MAGTATADAVRAVFADPNVGIDATYTPAGGSGVPVRAILTTASARTDVFGAAVASTGRTIELQAAEVGTPVRGDTIAIGASVWTINVDPRPSDDGLVWVCEVVAA